MLIHHIRNLILSIRSRERRKNARKKKSSIAACDSGRRRRRRLPPPPPPSPPPPPLYSPDLHKPGCFALADHRRLKQARVVVGGRGALAAPSAGTISSAGAVSPYWIRIRSRASTFFILVEPSPLGSTVAVCIL